MIFPIPQKHSGIVTEITSLNSKVVRLSIKVSDSFNFIAGQFISLKVSDKNYRSYSISSSPSALPEFSLLVAVGHEGAGSNYIRGLKLKDVVDFIGPSGRFVLPETLSDTLIFIATGTGIGPLFSMLSRLAEEETNSKIQLLFGIRDESELFELQKILELKVRLKNFSYRVCFSQHLPAEFVNGFLGRVTENLEIVSDAQYFICGNPFMVHEVDELLSSNNIQPDKIFHEKFTVAKKLAN